MKKLLIALTVLALGLPTNVFALSQTINLSAPYTWSGLQNFTAGLLSVGSTTFNGNATTTGKLSIGSTLTVGTTTSRSALTLADTSDTPLLTIGNTAGIYQVGFPTAASGVAV